MPRSTTKTGLAQILVPVATVGVALVSIMLVSSVPRPRHSRRPANTHLQCVGCGHQWTMTPQKMREATSMIDPSNPRAMVPGMALLECPECQTQPPSGVVMSKCPACGEYYITEEQRMMAQTGRPPMGPLKPPVCPHCGTNIRKFYRNLAPDRTHH